MKTTPVTPADLSRSVVAVPPFARNADLTPNWKANAALIAHLQDGGVRSLMYGGNANFYHLAPSEYAGRAGLPRRNSRRRHLGAALGWAGLRQARRPGRDPEGPRISYRDAAADDLPIHGRRPRCGHPPLHRHPCETGGGLHQVRPLHPAGDHRQAVRGRAGGRREIRGGAGRTRPTTPIFANWQRWCRASGW